jgi:hypothetical protein
MFRGVGVRGMRKMNDVERCNHFNELSGSGAPSSFVPNIVCLFRNVIKKCNKARIMLVTHFTQMTYAAVEKLLHAKTVSKTAFQSFPVDTLAEICGTYKLPVTGTSQRPKGSKNKSDLIVCFQVLPWFFKPYVLYFLFG